MSIMAVNKSDGYSTGEAFAAGRKRHDMLEFSVAYGLILVAIWTPQPWGRVISLAALVWVVLATRVSFDGWEAMGLRMMGFWRSLWVVGVALVLAAASVTLAGRLQTLHAPPHPLLFVERYGGYIVWAFLQDFFLLRLQRLLSGKQGAVIAAAGLFAVAHLPNPILTVLTLLWGWVACRLFLRYRNVYTLAIAHAIFGICIALSFPAAVIHNMRVGLGYLRY
jgi:hypothetical protein